LGHLTVVRLLKLIDLLYKLE